MAMDKLVVPREVKPDWRGTDDEYAKLPVQDVMKSIWNDLVLSINRWTARLEKCLQRFRENWPYRESDVISSGHFTAVERSATDTVVEPFTSTGTDPRHKGQLIASVVSWLTQAEQRRVAQAGDGGVLMALGRGGACKWYTRMRLPAQTRTQQRQQQQVQQRLSSQSASATVGSRRPGQQQHDWITPPSTLGTCQCNTFSCACPVPRSTKQPRKSSKVGNSGSKDVVASSAPSVELTPGQMAEVNNANSLLLLWV